MLKSSCIPFHFLLLIQNLTAYANVISPQLSLLQTHSLEWKMILNHYSGKKILFLLVTQINKCCTTLGLPPLTDLPQETVIHTVFRQKYPFMQSSLVMLFPYPSLCFQLFLPNLLPQQIPQATLRIHLLWVRFCFNQTVF